MFRRLITISTFCVESPADVDAFIAIIHRKLGITLTPEYVRGNGYFVKIREKVVATFLLKAGHDLRLLAQIPDGPQKQEFLVLSDGGQDAVEANAVWVSRDVRSGWLNLCVWLVMISKIFSSKEKYLLVSRNLKNKGIARYHAVLPLVRIYEGEPLALAHSTTFQRVAFSYMRQRNFLWVALLGWRFILRRLAFDCKVLLRRTFAD